MLRAAGILSADDLLAKYTELAAVGGEEAAAFNLGRHLQTIGVSKPFQLTQSVQLYAQAMGRVVAAPPSAVRPATSSVAPVEAVEQGADSMSAALHAMQLQDDAGASFLLPARGAAGTLGSAVTSQERDARTGLVRRPSVDLGDALGGRVRSSARRWLTLALRSKRCRTATTKIRWPVQCLSGPQHS